MTEQKQQLEQQLWNIANTLRGKMDADDFRDYILGFIFYKYLSTKMELYANKALIDAYIYSGQEPIRDEVFKCLNNRPSILKAREIGERILDKMKEFVEVFVNGMTG